MAEIGGGGGAGVVEGIGNVLGMLGDRLDQHHIQRQKERDLMADHLETQGKEIADNIMRVGGFDAPEAAPLVEQLKGVTERHNSLFPPHETPKLIKRLQKIIGHEPAKAKPDARASMDPGEVLARARRPEFKDTPAGQRQQAGVTREIAGENAVEAGRLKRVQNEADLTHAKQSGLPQEQLDQIRAVQEGVPVALLKPPAEHSGQWKPVYGTLANGDPFSYMYSAATNEKTDMNGRPLEPGALDGFKVAPTTSRAPKTAWSKDTNGRYFSVQLDANNQKVPGSENYDLVPPASITGRITTGSYFLQDLEGFVHEIPTQHTSTPIGQPGVAPSATPPAAAQPPGAPGAGAPAGPAAGAPKPGAAAANPGATIPATPAQARERVVGRKATPPITEARTAWNSAVGLAKEADEAWTKPSATKDKKLALRIIREAAGRYNQAEFDIMTKKAGLGNTLEGWANSLTTGELPTDVRRQLVEVAKGQERAMKAALDNAMGTATGGASAAPAGRPGNPLGLNLPGL